jgi:hypothetical protein
MFQAFNYSQTVKAGYAVAEVSNVCLIMPESCEMAQGGKDKADETSFDTQLQIDSGNAFTLSLSRDHSWVKIIVSAIVANCQRCSTI